MRSPRICRRALLIGHLKANPMSKDAGRKCAEESAAFKGKARSAAKPAARPRTNRGDRASVCDEVACVKTALGFNKKKPHPGCRVLRQKRRDDPSLRGAPALGFPFRYTHAVETQHQRIDLHSGKPPEKSCIKCEAVECHVGSSSLFRVWRASPPRSAARAWQWAWERSRRSSSRAGTRQDCRASSSSCSGTPSAR